jgi:hypothetical protein
MWKLAWPKIAVVIVLAFGALAGLSSRRLGQLRNSLRNKEGAGRMVSRKLHSAFFKISLSLRMGLVLAAVFLMTAKPNLMGSLGGVLAFVLVFLGLGLLGNNTPVPEPAATAGKFETSTR